MITFFLKALNAARKYTLMDFGCLKIAVLSCGILLGAYFASFFMNIVGIVWVVFILSFLWIIYRTFVKLMN